MQLQTLVFNTTTKTVKITIIQSYGEETIISFENVPTVKIKPEGYYEVIQKEAEANYPVARFPIANTNMIIEK